MQLLGIIKRSFHLKLASTIGAIVCGAALLSAFFFYVAIERQLGETYARKIQTLSIYKFEVVRQSLIIFAGFAFIALAGIVTFAVVYTHRIAGPLFRIRVVAKDLAAGNFDRVTRFRKNDAIHPLAESMNQFASEQGKRSDSLRDCIDQMRDGAGELRELIRKGDTEMTAAARLKVAKKTEELNKILAGIKI